MTGIAPFLEELYVPAELADPIESAILFILGFVILYLLGKGIVLPLVHRLIDRRELDAHARKPILKIARFIIIFVAITLAFGVAGLGNFLIAFTGIAAAGTLALGFAMQNVIRNFVAGVFIYVDKPFRIGDWIEWNDRVGIVEDIRLRTTRVRTFDNELLTVPNSELTDNVVKNPVAKTQIRQRFTVGIGFDDDVKEASQYMIDVANEHPEILEDPEPTVRLTDLGDSAVLLQARFWIDEPKRADFIRIRGEYGTQIKRRFDEEGIDIPFPIRTLDGQVAIAEPDALVD